MSVLAEQVGHDVGRLVHRHVGVRIDQERELQLATHAPDLAAVALPAPWAGVYDRLKTQRRKRLASDATVGADLVFVDLERLFGVLRSNVVVVPEVGSCGARRRRGRDIQEANQVHHAFPKGDCRS